MIERYGQMCEHSINVLAELVYVITEAIETQEGLVMSASLSPKV